MGAGSASFPQASSWSTPPQTT